MDLKKLICLFFLPVFFLSGCLHNEETVSTAPDYPCSIGNVVLEKAPKKVVSLSPFVTEQLCELGGKALLVGRGELCNYPQHVASLPVLSAAFLPKLDEIIALKPDIVICQTPFSKSEIAKLSAAKIHYLVLSPPESFAALEKNYTDLGKLLYGTNTGATKGKAAYSLLANKYKQLKTALAKVSNKKTFVLFPATCPDFPKITYKDDYVTSLLQIFGASIDFAKKDPTTPEYIAQQNPSFIFTDKAIAIQSIRDVALFQTVAAAGNGQIFEIDSALLKRYSLRDIAELEALAKRLFPDAFASAPSAPQSSAGSGASSAPTM